jgi:chorismate mutase / prephenate dehydratase
MHDVRESAVSDGGPNLEGLRRQIDDLDDRIIDLLDERAALMRDVAFLKEAQGMMLHDPEREDALIERVCARTRRFPRPCVAVVYTEIMSACLGLQHGWLSS